MLVVVQVDRTRADGVYYKVNLAYRDGVTVPTPPLQEPPVFVRGPEFKSWLLLKRTCCATHATRRSLPLAHNTLTHLLLSYQCGARSVRVAALPEADPEYAPDPHRRATDQLQQRRTEPASVSVLSFCVGLFFFCLHSHKPDVFSVVRAEQLGPDDCGAKR